MRRDRIPWNDPINASKMTIKEVRERLGDGVTTFAGKGIREAVDALDGAQGNGYITDKTIKEVSDASG